MPPKPKPARRKASLAPRWERRQIFGYFARAAKTCVISPGSIWEIWMCSASTVMGIRPRRLASGCFGETTMGTLTVSRGSWLSCGGNCAQDPTTPMAQRPSSTGSITALDSMSNLSSVAGNSFWKADTPGDKAAGQAFRPRFEEVDVARHRARIGKQRAALIRQHRKMSAAIEEFHTELTFKIGQSLAHHGLGATQAAACRGETALVRGRDESAQLIQ